jgi:hypothetical protein
MFEPLFAVCILGSIVVIIFSITLIFIRVDSIKQDETHKFIAVCIILTIALAWTTGFLAVNKFVRERDEDAITNGVMRWVSDERGNLSRQWIKPVVNVEKSVEIKKH